MIDERGRSILKTLIERYIVEGNPVGSRALSKWSLLDLSAATIRNVMADLEEMQYVASPHTSAGRVPTPQGYRMFVDSLLTVKPLSEDVESRISQQLQPDDSNLVINRAADLLSGLSSFAGVVTSSKKAASFRQIEFVTLSQQRVLLILVTPEGDVQNRVLLCERAYTQSELTEAANFFNQNYAGMRFDEVKVKMASELDQLSKDIALLMRTAVNTGEEAVDESSEKVYVAGERRLLDVADWSNDLSRIKKLFEVFERRTELLHLLDSTQTAKGVQIFIGGNSALVPMEDMSVISAPYDVNGQVVGTLAVIGPTRMAYEKLIPIVDITSKLVSSALSV